MPASGSLSGGTDRYGCTLIKMITARRTGSSKTRAAVMGMCQRCCCRSSGVRLRPPVAARGVRLAFVRRLAQPVVPFNRPHQLDERLDVLADGVERRLLLDP